MKIKCTTNVKNRVHEAILSEKFNPKKHKIILKIINAGALCHLRLYSIFNGSNALSRNFRLIQTFKD